MIDDGKKLYKACADENLENWLELSKSDLCNLYIETDSKQIKEGAIAAIIYKCWNIFNHNYRALPYIPIEEWYDSMIEAIMYVLNGHVWTNPENSLYGKPAGPEMALHRCIWSRKLNLYLSTNKPKRVINKNICSIEDLKERAGMDPGCELNEDNYIFIEYILSLITKDKIVCAILLDLIESGIIKNKLIREIRNLNSRYIDYFSKRYKADYDKVEKTVTELLNNSKLDLYIDYYLTCLLRDDDTLKYLKN